MRTGFGPSFSASQRTFLGLGQPRDLLLTNLICWWDARVSGEGTARSCSRAGSESAAHDNARPFSAGIPKQIECAMVSSPVRRGAVARPASHRDHFSPFRQMITPSGQTMSVSMTTCGTLHRVSDRKGYPYPSEDPLTGRAWPVTSKSFADLARPTAAAYFG
jgi:hypothetical protein